MFETSSEILDSTRNEIIKDEIPQENSNVDTAYLEESKRLDTFFAERQNSRKNMIKIPIIQ